MVNRLLQMLAIRCRHTKTSLPFAAAVSTGTHDSGGDWESVGSGAAHYVVCLDCGKKFAYDWQNMRIIGS